jgi:hypothetical protein
MELFHRENAEYIYVWELKRYSLSNQVFRLSSNDIILGRKGSLHEMQVDRGCEDVVR